jgi:hypothetical protein
MCGQPAGAAAVGCNDRDGSAEWREANRERYKMFEKA